jgi:hypothetical protein
VSGAQRRHRTSTVLDHDAALGCADRVFATAHPAEPVATVVLRAGEAALRSYVEGRPTLRAVPHDIDGVAVDPLRRLFTRHLGERLPDDAAGTLFAAVTAAAAVAALELAVSEWLAAGGEPEGLPVCQERFRAVAPLLPQGR